MALVNAGRNVGIGTEEADRFWVWGLGIVIHKRGMELTHGAPGSNNVNAKMKPH